MYAIEKWHIYQDQHDPTCNSGLMYTTALMQVAEVYIPVSRIKVLKL